MGLRMGRVARIAAILLCVAVFMQVTWPVLASRVMGGAGGSAYAAKFLSADGGSMSASEAEELKASQDAAAGIVDPNSAVGAVASGLSDATYYGSAEGFKSTIAVAVTVRDGKIAQIQVVSEDDDAAYFKFGSKVIERIIDKQRVDIDGVTGATYSSEGIRDAVAAALSGDEGQRMAGMVMMCLGYLTAVLAVASLAGICLTSLRRARAQKARERLDWARWQRLSVQALFFSLAPSVFATAFSAIKNALHAVWGYEPVEFTVFAATLFALLALTALFGRFFCGYACSFGLLGDLVYRASGALMRKLGVKSRPRIPEKAARGLRAGKYLVLAAIVVAALMGASPLINENSPWTSFSRLSSLSVRGLTLVSVASLVAILVGMAFEERFFCRFLCPLGAIFSLMPTLPSGRHRRNRPTCLKGCSACKKACPVGVEPKGGLLAGECVACGRCAETCPAGNVTCGLAGAPDEQGRRHERVPRWVSPLLKAALLLVLFWVLDLLRYLPSLGLFE